MGEMSSAYEQFTQAVRTCVMYQEFDIYPQKKKYLDEELKILECTKKADAMAVLNVKRELFELEINHRMETGPKPPDAGTGLRKHGEQPPHVGEEVPHQKPSRRHSGMGKDMGHERPGK